MELKPDECDTWPDETVYDVLNVLEAVHDDELGYLDNEHVEVARTLGLLEGGQMTEKGKLLFLGYAASQTVASTEKALLFAEIESEARGSGFFYRPREVGP